MRTLIVEDVHFLALILQRIIEPYSKADFAQNGAVAIDKYTKAFTKGKAYDLICLDLLLPEMDGFEVLRSLRQFEDEFNLPPEARTKVVVISTFNDQNTVNKARAAGCDSYIAKPFRKDRVLKTIEKLGLIEYSIKDDDDNDKYNAL
jgi:two-component system, chemotaxis family, chemotaxis protein CheY